MSQALSDVGDCTVLQEDFGSAGALQNLTRLTCLALQDTTCNDDMSAFLQPLRHMRILALSRTLISDAGEADSFKFHSRSTTCSSIHIFANTAALIDSAASGLEQDTLCACAGLANLAGMTALRCLAFEGCQEITSTGVRQHLQPLNAQHPLSEVCFDFGDQEMTKAVETHLQGCRVQGFFNDARFTPGHAAENW